MQIVHQPGGMPKLPHGSVVTVGNFDGMHLAHQQLLRRVAGRARDLSAAAVAITFDPHPIRVLAPDRAPKLLTTLAQRQSLIGQQGMDILLILSFTRELAHMAPKEFVLDILAESVQARLAVVGPNFRFGYRQAGDVHTLVTAGRELGLGVEILPSVQVRGEAVSSTRVRDLLSAGHVQIAARLLGRPFSNSGPIVAGLGIGHRHTVPTLNLAPAEEQLPKIGVYVTRTQLGGKWWRSVTNVGRKPTFGEHAVTVETYLLNFAGEIKENEMTVEYLYRLRDEIKFQNPALLKIQIQEDARRSVKFFRLLERLRKAPTHGRP
jgi:riboflavin kinase / FMN adenylyltransferase